MTFQKKVKAISLLAASSLTFLTGNSLKASEEYPTGMYGTISLGAGKVSHFDDQLGTDIDYAYDLFYELGLGYDFGKNFRTDISYIRGRSEVDGKASGINDGDVVTKAYSDSGTQTMTNKTLTAPVLNAPVVTDLSVNDIVTNGSNADFTIDTAGTGDINLTAGADINVPANIGITFGDDAEKIEGDGTDLTISGNIINPTTDSLVSVVETPTILILLPAALSIAHLVSEWSNTNCAFVEPTLPTLKPASVDASAVEPVKFKSIIGSSTANVDTF